MDQLIPVEGLDAGVLLVGDPDGWPVAGATVG